VEWSDCIPRVEGSDDAEGGRPYNAGSGLAISFPKEESDGFREGGLETATTENPSGSAGGCFTNAICTGSTVFFGSGAEVINGVFAVPLIDSAPAT
jgi:hypothetical protein